MTRRNRLTRASAPPAIPVEEGGYEHPAASEDPHMDAYKNGDTSSWAEDPHPGPYTQGDPPAIPTEDGAHPAAKRAAQQRKQAAYRKAGKCVKIAQFVLGKTATEDQLEIPAVALMDLNERQIDATLNRLGKFITNNRRLASIDQDHYAGNFLAEDQSENDAFGGLDMEADMDVYSNADLYGGEDAMGGDEIMGEDAAMLAMMEDEMMDDPMMDDPMMDDMMDPMMDPMMDDGMDMSGLDDEERMMLASMIAEASEDDEDKEVRAMLAELMAEDESGKTAGDDDEEEEEEEDSGKTAGEEKEEEEEEEEEDEGKKASELGISLSGDLDLMEEIDLSTEDRAILASLYNEVSDLPTEVTKQATQLRPTDRKPSQGIQSVGNLSKAASADVDDLSNLWKSDPDVSDIFR